MLHRACPDLTPPTEADLDTPEMAAAAADVERNERGLRVLARLTDVAARLSDALGRLAEARIEAAIADNDADLKPSEEAAAAFNKMAQTVRRTVALEAKLAAGVNTRRDGLFAERAGRRASRSEAHEAAKTEAVLGGLHDAYAGSTSDEEYAEQVERLMEDAAEYLGEADEMRGWLDRPVGETVARLCASLGLDPDACTLDGETWTVRRPTTELERLAAERAQKPGDPPPSLFPFPSEEGQDARHPGWGSVDEASAVGESASP